MSTERTVVMTICNVDNNLCGWDCVYRKGMSKWDCSLFSIDLEDNDQFVDQNDKPLKERCSRCIETF